MGGFPFAHIDHFDIIVFMFWKMNKPGVRSDADQFSVLQHLPAVNMKSTSHFHLAGCNEFVSLCVPCPVNLRATV